jgi:hypothetical protein
MLGASITGSIRFDWVQPDGCFPSYETYRRPRNPRAISAPVSHREGYGSSPWSKELGPVVI